MSHPDDHQHTGPSVTKAHLLREHDTSEELLKEVRPDMWPALHARLHEKENHVHDAIHETIYVDDQGIFDMGEIRMYQLPCRHTIKINRLLHGDDDVHTRQAILEHLNTHVTILVRLGPGNPISKTLRP